MGNKTLLESPPGAGGINEGEGQGDPTPIFGGGSAPYRY